MNLRFGYACINNTLRGEDIYTGRTCILKTLREDPTRAANLALRNFTDLEKILVWNKENKINLYRISSDIYPHLDNLLAKNIIAPNNETIYNLLEPLSEIANRIGNFAKTNGMRLTMHPGQFNVLGSPDILKVQATYRDLEKHAAILQLLGCESATNENRSIIVIHGGGAYGDKPAAIERFKTNYRALPNLVKQWLTIENDEFTFSANDIINLCETIEAPMIFDYFHNECNYDHTLVTPEFLQRVVKTWHNVRPKFHHSTQKPNARRGAHSDSITEIPQILLDLSREIPIDIMLEVKNKEISVLHCKKKYNV